MADVTAFTADELDVAASVRSRLARREAKPPSGVEAEELDREVWSQLAELGVWSVADEEVDGSAGLVVAVATEVGRGLVLGPLGATFAAVRIGAAAAGDDVASGRRLATVAIGEHVPWAASCDVVLERDDPAAQLLEVTDRHEDVQTLSGAVWSRVAVRRATRVPEATEAWAAHDLGVASYCLGAAQHALAVAVEYAGTREQFGRPIGDNQAVSHPLVDARLRLGSSARLVKMAATAVDREHDDAGPLVAAAVGSAGRAALAGVAVAHQTMGAIGYTLEGPIARATRLVRHHVTTARTLRGPHRALDLFSSRKDQP